MQERQALQAVMHIGAFDGLELGRTRGLLGSGRRGARAIPKTMPTTSTRWLIMVVEDDPIIGMMLGDMLQQLDCRQVGPAGSVAAALSLLDATPTLDAALLDCNLGGEKVWPVADRLVARNVPFIFCTGYGQAGVDARFEGIPVLNKPFPMRALQRELRRLLQQG